MVNLTDSIKELLSLTDLILLDIKHIDDEKCKDLVGFSNKKELEFAKYLSDNNIPVWIRQVIVPGFNDSEEYMKGLADYVKNNVKNFEKLEVLPYHVLGVSKYEGLNIPYPLEGVEPMNKEDAKIYSDFFYKYY